MKTKHISQRYTGKTFAQASKKISDKYKDRDTNPLSKRSFLAEIEELVKMQEVTRIKEAAVDTLQQNRRLLKAMGGNLPKYVNAGVLGDPTKYVSRFHPDAFSSNKSKDKQFNINLSPTRTTLLPTGLTNPTVGQVTSVLPTDNTLATAPLPVTDKPLTLGKPLTTTLGDANRLTTLVNQSIDKSKAVKESKTGFLSNVMTPLAIGKGIETLGKGLMAASGYERYSPILNPYEAQSRRELEQMQFDITPVTQKLQQEQARARGSVSGIQNEAVRQSLLQNTQSEVMSRLQEAMLSGQQQENAYRQARAAGLQSLGSEQRGAREQARAMTTASKAQLQSFVGDMLGSAGQAGQEITNYRANIAQQDLLAATLGSKDFKFASAKDIINKAVSGGVKLSVDDLYVLNNPTVPGYEAKVKEINERLAKLPQNKKGGWLNSLKL